MARWQPVERDARYRKRRRAGFPTALSEGDSWFDYPFFLNLIDLVEDAELFAHYRLEQSGDTVANMIGSAAALRNLRTVVEQVQPLCVLFSGGGNDVADRAAGLFCASDSPDPLTCVDMPAVTAFFEFIDERYREMVAQIAPIAPIITHGYDYFAPAPTPVRFNGVAFGIGPWIYPQMVARGITEPERQRAVSRWLIDEFNDVLQRIQRDQPADFVHVDLRGVLDIERDWENEIHPTRAGFRKVANRFVQEIRTRLPDVVRVRLRDRLVAGG
jgi:metacaspase-1